MAAPIPLEAPVTTATLPSNFAIAISFWYHVDISTTVYTMEVGMAGIQLLFRVCSTPNRNVRFCVN
jgi:hypothetical protein